MIVVIVKDIVVAKANVMNSAVRKNEYLLPIFKANNQLGKKTRNFNIYSLAPMNDLFLILVHKQLRCHVITINDKNEKNHVSLSFVSSSTSLASTITATSFQLCFLFVAKSSNRPLHPQSKHS